jgi:hypothetical protein
LSYWETWHCCRAYCKQNTMPKPAATHVITLSHSLSLSLSLSSFLSLSLSHTQTHTNTKSMLSLERHNVNISINPHLHRGGSQLSPKPGWAGSPVRQGCPPGWRPQHSCSLRSLPSVLPHSPLDGPQDLSPPSGVRAGSAPVSAQGGPGCLCRQRPSAEHSLQHIIPQGTCLACRSTHCFW